MDGWRKLFTIGGTVMLPLGIEIVHPQKSNWHIHEEVVIERPCEILPMSIAVSGALDDYHLYDDNDSLR